METQLRLINGSDEGGAGPPSWRLTDETCRIGRQGIALARQELRKATVAAGIQESHNPSGASQLEPVPTTDCIDRDDESRNHQPSAA